MAASSAWPKSFSVADAMESSFALAAVAGSLWRCSQGMSQWSWAELSLGLGQVAVKHAQEQALDTLQRPQPVASREELRELLHWVRWAMASYEADTSALSSDLDIPEAHIMRHVAQSSVGRPAYLVARDEKRRAVVVSIRGTHSSSDLLTDLALDSCPFRTGWAHAGMLKAARWIQSEIGAKVTHVAVSKGWNVVVVGHSLGAGSAALLAMLLQEDIQRAHEQQQGQQGASTVSSDPLEGLAALSLAAGPSAAPVPPSPQIQNKGSVLCWAFACPPVVSQNLAAQGSDLVRSIVLQHDLVPRLCPEAFEELRQEVVQVLGSQGKPKSTPLAASSTSMFDLLASAAVNAVQSHVAAQPQSGQPSGFAASLRSLSLSGGGAAGAKGQTSASAWMAVAGTAASAVLSQIGQPTTTGEGPLPKGPAARLRVPGALFHILRDTKSPAEQPRASIEDLMEWEREGGGASEVSLFLREREGMDARGVATGEEASSSSSSASQSPPLSSFFSRSQSTSSSSLGFFVGSSREGTSASNNKGHQVLPSERYRVVKGSPAAGFKRLVMASSILSDHSCRLQGHAIIDAMRWC